MKPLEPPDSLHLQAAQGWCELHAFLEANDEREKITRRHREPDEHDIISPPPAYRRNPAGRLEDQSRAARARLSSSSMTTTLCAR